MIQAAGEQKIFFAFWPVVLTPSPCRTCHYHHNARFTFSDRYVRFNEPAHPSGHYLSGHSKRRCWDFYEGTVTTGHVHIGRSWRGVAIRIIVVLLRARLSNPDLSITVNNALSPAISTAQRERSGESWWPVYVGKFWRRSVRHKGRVCFRVMSGFTFRSLTVPSIAPQPRCDRYINCVEKKSSGGAFIPLLKHGRHFVSMCAARNSGCYLYSEVISGGGGGGQEGREGERVAD